MWMNELPLPLQEAVKKLEPWLGSQGWASCRNFRTRGIEGMGKGRPGGVMNACVVAHRYPGYFETLNIEQNESFLPSGEGD